MIIDNIIVSSTRIDGRFISEMWLSVNYFNYGFCWILRVIDLHWVSTYIPDIPRLRYIKFSLLFLHILFSRPLINVPIQGPRVCGGWSDKLIVFPEWMIGGWGWQSKRLRRRRVVGRGIKVASHWRPRRVSHAIRTYARAPSSFRTVD